MKTSKKPNKILLILVVFLFFIFLNRPSFSDKIKNPFYSFSESIQKSFWYLGTRISDSIDAFSSIENLQKENKELKLKILSFLSDKAELERLRSENIALRESMDIDLEKEFSLKWVEVIGKDILEDYIIIGKGKDDGVYEGQVLITSQKALVGKVVRLYNKRSIVQLLSHPESLIDAKIIERNIAGVLKGKGGFSLVLDLLPKDKEIFVDDIVVTTALGGIYPKDLLIGTIKSIEALDLEFFQRAELELAYQIGTANNIFLIKDF